MMRRFRTEILELGRSGDAQTLLEEFSSYLDDGSALGFSNRIESFYPAGEEAAEFFRRFS